MRLRISTLCRVPGRSDGLGVIENGDTMSDCFDLIRNLHFCRPVVELKGSPDIRSEESSWQAKGYAAGVLIMLTLVSMHGRTFKLVAPI